MCLRTLSLHDRLVVTSVVTVSSRRPCPATSCLGKTVARVSVVSKGLLKRASREVLVQAVVRARPASPPV